MQEAALASVVLLVGCVLLGPIGPGCCLSGDLISMLQSRCLSCVKGLAGAGSSGWLVGMCECMCTVRQQHLCVGAHVRCVSSTGVRVCTCEVHC